MVVLGEWGRGGGEEVPSALLLLGLCTGVEPEPQAQVLSRTQTNLGSSPLQSILAGFSGEDR